MSKPHALERHTVAQLHAIGAKPSSGGELSQRALFVPLVGNTAISFSRGYSPRAGNKQAEHITIWIQFEDAERAIAAGFDCSPSGKYDHYFLATKEHINNILLNLMRPLTTAKQSLTDYINELISDSEKMDTTENAEEYGESYKNGFRNALRLVLEFNNKE